jgi:hypothetical protein
LPVTDTLLSRLAEALRECSDDLAAEISARYAGTLHYPVQQHGYDRDMAPVERARALLAELAAANNV